MFNVSKRAFATVLAVMLCACAAGCSFQPDLGEHNEQINTNQTQIYVYNYDGGYGSEWLYDAKARFEELHKDDEWETGKKGVQVYVDPVKQLPEASYVRDGRNEVYFCEEVKYFDLMADNVLEDITDALTADLSAFGDADGRTIADKLAPEQESYYNIKDDDGNSHYYGLPHYSSAFGFSYNIDVFDKYGLYFKKDADVDGYLNKTVTIDSLFVLSNVVGDKSVGIDGIPGTDDDGLPTTYDEFFILCDYMKDVWKLTPFTIAGNAYNGYLNYLMMALAADYEGKDQYMLNFTVDGKATTLGTVVDGQFVFDDEPTVITPDVPASLIELTRQGGRYYAAGFIRELTRREGGQNKYAYAGLSGNAFSSSYTHMSAQEDFLRAGNDGGATAPIGMLCDGIYWQNEAYRTFESMEYEMGSEFGMRNRNLGFMPLPKANKEKLQEARDRAATGGKLYTMLDYCQSMCYVKKGIDAWKKPLILEFIEFLYSDAELAKFTDNVGVPKSLSYEIPSADYEKLSPFTQSVYDLRSASDIAYPYANNKTFVDNQPEFMYDRYYMARIDGRNYEYCATPFLDHQDWTAEMWFNGSYEYRTLYPILK